MPVAFFTEVPAPPPSQRDGIIQPRVARDELPWVSSSYKSSTLQGLYRLLSMNTRAPIYGAEERQEERAATLSGLMGLLFVSPRVARSSQPWAERRNPFGIERNGLAPQKVMAFGFQTGALS